MVNTRSLSGPFVRVVVLALCLVGALPGMAAARACVWLVTDDAGHSLYLAGSIHALRPSDYPLPPEYDRALAASVGVAFEIAPVTRGNQFGEDLSKAGELPRGVSLKDKVDPRTYAYISKVVANAHGTTEPMKKIDRLRPWAISFILSTPGGSSGVSGRRGVEAYVMGRMRGTSKKMEGLETLSEHIAVFGGLSDAESEEVLLHAFIHLNADGTEYDKSVAAWKRGDANALTQGDMDDYRDLPSFRKRIITDRNNAWIPKLERYLRSGKTWTALAGAAHMGGSEGVPELLRARGYHVEQL